MLVRIRTEAPGLVMGGQPCRCADQRLIVLQHPRQFVIEAFVEPIFDPVAAVGNPLRNENSAERRPIVVGVIAFRHCDWKARAT